MKILITLPNVRWQLGTLRLVGEAELFRCRCYSKADSQEAAKAGNPTRDPTRRNGDTPAGTYRGTVEQRPMEPEKTYGKWPPIRLHPTGGDALTAANNGRKGLLIHGGWLSNDGKLRATNGCLRIEDRHVNELLAFLRKENLTEISVEIEEV